LWKHQHNVGICDTNGCIVVLTCAQELATTSLKPQAKLLQFISLLKLKNLADEAGTGKLPVCKSAVEECY
jgi:hypothetical protein